MIELKNTVKKFGDFTALDDITLTIPEGTAFGLLGSNGAGKSTLLRLLTGIYSPDGGTVQLDGKDVFNNEEQKRRVFFVNDETVQFGSFTLKGLKDYYKGFYPNFSEEIYKKLVETVKLPENKKIDTFSKGMKRQAIVIVGLACCTEYLLLDEAFDGLDPTMRIIVKHMLVDAMLDRKLTVVISSHNLKEINEVCDTAALMHQGKIIFSRELDSVKGDIHKIQVSFPEEHTREEFECEELLHFERSGSIYYMIMRGSEENIKEKISCFSPVVFDVIPLTLEEIFIYEMEVLGYDANGIEKE